MADACCTSCAKGLPCEGACPAHDHHKDNRGSLVPGPLAASMAMAMDTPRDTGCVMPRGTVTEDDVDRQLAEVQHPARTTGDVRAGTADGVPRGVDPALWARMTTAQRDRYFTDGTLPSSGSSGGGSGGGSGSATLDLDNISREDWNRLSPQERTALIQRSNRSAQEKATLIATAVSGSFDTLRTILNNTQALAMERARLAAQGEQQRADHQFQLEMERLRQEGARYQLPAYIRPSPVNTITPAETPSTFWTPEVKMAAGGLTLLLALGAAHALSRPSQPAYPPPMYPQPAYYPPTPYGGR